MDFTETDENNDEITNVLPSDGCDLFDIFLVFITGIMMPIMGMVEDNGCIRREWKY